MTDIQQAPLAQELRDYIAETFLYMHPEVDLKDDDQFLELGVIDSLGFVELVDEVQTRYGITVDDVEITEENFGSIVALVAFIEAKRAA
ncbi:acyl carrier protein [Conexibacter sp. JD483]|uniref:acyl carrier protein n=1 Tax=unclassified Conexibacter TaxID=2627773 RepID=UPI002719180A|nr:MULTISPECIES: acyl carrier protein [unclassified Conexibacter]MDO8184245.1 acyl carrier protein [Conexibacter sp. CPCC 205706]MDO8197237.1 acyl carrier protein [Conexibacter sp. CPCC 205762]MDR9367448.1 acyl carrier protein [Conexibacter sp. JD483]